tara:strand:- start:707 stop:1378 length:672 start_codon:yes stop_codon:yes gene_type:complete
MVIKSEEDVYRFYNEVFKLLYADLVAVTAQKSEQVSFELQACLDHIVVAQTCNDTAISEDNFRKAHGHLVRASLDCAKLLWIELKNRAKVFLDDKEVMELAHNSSMDKCYSTYKEAEDLSKEARRLESQNSGISPEDTIDIWYKAIEALNRFIEMFVESKVTSVKKVRKNKALKDRIVDILISFIVGTIVTVLLGYMTNTFEIKKPDLLVNILYSDSETVLDK